MSTPVIAVDRFPVDVATSTASYRTAKLIMTQPQDGVGQLKVWSSPGVLELDTTFDLAESDIRSKQVDWTVASGLGPVTVKSSSGCGCGNRLKLWTPPEFAPYKMGKLR